MEKYVCLFRKRTLKMELLIFKSLPSSDQSTLGHVTYCVMYSMYNVLLYFGTNNSWVVI